MPDNSNIITPPTHSFAGRPVGTRLEELEADIAVIGIHYVSPYPQLLTTTATQPAVETAQDAIRLRSSVFSDHWDHYLITIDADALDTAIAPGVLFPTPGSLTFDETTDLFQAIAARGPIAGISLFEVRPERDINGLTAATGAQLIISFIGTLARSSRNGN